MQHHPLYNVWWYRVEMLPYKENQVGGFVMQPQTTASQLAAPFETLIHPLKDDAGLIRASI